MDLSNSCVATDSNPELRVLEDISKVIRELEALFVVTSTSGLICT